MDQNPQFFLNCCLCIPDEKELATASTFLEKQTLPMEHFCLIVPYLLLQPFSSKFGQSGIALCSERMLDVAPGSFTASIAGSMLKNAGARFVLINSRGEKEDSKAPIPVKEKIAKAVEAQLQPILAVGESAAEMEENRSGQVLESQLAVLSDMPADIWDKLLILYEAPWLQRQTIEGSLALLSSSFSQFNESVKKNLPPQAAEQVKVIYPAPRREFIEASHPFSPAGFYLGALAHFAAEPLLDILDL